MFYFLGLGASYLPKSQSHKHATRNNRSAARQKKYRDKMTAEQKEEYKRKARERYLKRKAEHREKIMRELSITEESTEDLQNQGHFLCGI